jgi:hypothetical protein
MFGKITIRPFGPTAWQASVPLLMRDFDKVPGVMGSHSEDGPWIGATGSTPDAALAALRGNIGAVMLGACLAEPLASESESMGEKR